MDINKLHNEDNRITMSRMACDSIDTIITDPPYGLQFMGKKWDYDIPSAETFAEMYRVAKPGATLLCFGGTRTWHRIAVNIEDAGWEIRDTLMWLYGSGFPKAADLSKMFDKKNGVERKVIGKAASQPAKGGHFGGLTGDNIQFTENGERYSPDITSPTSPTSPDAITWNGWKSHGLKPAYEPIIMAIKPNDGTYIENALKHGVSGLNIDGGRIPIASDENNPSGSGNMYLKNNAFNPVKTTKRKERKSETWKNGSGFKNENNNIAETNPKGRFPSNVLLNERAAEILDEQTGTLTSGIMKAGTKRQMSSNPNVNTYAEWKADEVESDTYGDTGGASRFFYIAKTSSFERHYGCTEMEKNHHPTVKPLRLMMYLCELTKTPTGGIVYDPFSGSGTTLIAAKLTGRNFIGSEIEKDSCKIAEARLKHHHEQIKLF